MNTSACVWTNQSNWLSVIAPPKRIAAPAPSKRKLGSTSSRAATVMPIARVQNSTSGAITSVHTPKPASASVSAVTAPASADRKLTLRLLAEIHRPAEQRRRQRDERRREIEHRLHAQHVGDDRLVEIIGGERRQQHLQQRDRRR